MGKAYLTTLLLIFLCLAGLSQQPCWSNLVHSKPVIVERVAENPDPHLVFLPMSFARSDWGADIKQKLIDRSVLSVSLVYTRYKTVQSFDQIKLNEDRMNKLRAFVPELFDFPDTEWILVEQTGADSRATGNQYFHGFVIQTRPKPSKALSDKEMEELTKLKEDLLSGKDGSETEVIELKTAVDVTGPSTRKKVEFYIDEAQIRTLDSPAQFRGGNEGLTNFLIDNLNYPRSDLEAGVEGTVLISFTVGPDGEVSGVRTLNSVSSAIDDEAMRVMNMSPKWKPATEDGKKVSSTYTIPILFDADGDGKAARPVVGAVTKSLEYVPFGKDEVVTDVLDRNEWNNMAIICDLTGSMSPYTKQLLRWFSKNIENDRIHSFTFFNDGDGMPDRKKKVGMVGGIYHSQVKDVNELTNLMLSVMRNGDGDDNPENNIEATLETASRCTDCELVMIADNYATPRDLRLVDQIDRPLRIILCGASPHLNTNYLQLAFDTGGSVHSLYEDIGDLQGLADGTIINFGIYQYRLNNGRFVKEPLR